MEEEPLFTKVFQENRFEFDEEQMGADMVNVARRLVAEHPDIGAILFECTNMPPYAQAGQEAVGLSTSARLRNHPGSSTIVHARARRVLLHSGADRSARREENTAQGCDGSGTRSRFP